MHTCTCTCTYMYMYMYLYVHVHVHHLKGTRELCSALDVCIVHICCRMVPAVLTLRD